MKTGSERIYSYANLPVIPMTSEIYVAVNRTLNEKRRDPATSFKTDRNIFPSFYALSFEHPGKGMIDTEMLIFKARRKVILAANLV